MVYVIDDRLDAESKLSVTCLSFVDVQVLTQLLYQPNDCGNIDTILKCISAIVLSSYVPLPVNPREPRDYQIIQVASQIDDAVVCRTKCKQSDCLLQQPEI